MEDEGLLISQVRAAAADDLELLASLHDREIDVEALARLRASAFPRGLGLNPPASQWQDVMTVMERAFEAMEGSENEILTDLAAGYADVYLTHAMGVAPTESPWVDPDGLERQTTMAECRKWYGKYDLKVQNGLRPDDHLAYQLNFLGYLVGKTDQKETIGDAQRFLMYHLLNWVPKFAERLEQRRGPAFYSALAAVTACYLMELAPVLGAISGEVIAQPVVEVGDPEEASMRDGGCRGCYA